MAVRWVPGFAFGAFVVVVVELAVLIGIVHCAIDLNALDDGVLYAIKWPGLEPANLVDQIEPGAEVISINTNAGENFRCVIPPTEIQSESASHDYTGPNALELLEPLVKETSCSFRLESYWTYEVCHGKYVRQYHPEAGRAAKLQEYYLGKWDAERYKSEVAKLTESLKKDEPRTPLPTKKIDGMNVPYLELNMTDGTLCDLRPGSARSVRVLYICYRQGQHQIFSLEETRTCEYEVVVLSPLLCSHPDYRVRDRAHNDISCYATGADAAQPRRPLALREMEAESLKLRHQTTVLELSAGSGKRFTVEMNPVDIEEVRDIADQIAARAAESGLTDDEPLPIGKGTVVPVPRPEIPPSYDAKLVEDFLAGTHCLHGGTGWWKYEFCYGKKVLQYHTEPDGSTTSVLLGEFDRAAHIEWLAKNPKKQPSAGTSRNSISHFYTGGAICDVTGEPRHVEVKLKCREFSGTPGSKSTESLNAVSLYLYEPEVCSYVLGVESPILCQLLDSADEHGFLKAPTPVLPDYSKIPNKSTMDDESEGTESNSKILARESVVVVGIGEAIPIGNEEPLQFSKLKPSTSADTPSTVTSDARRFDDDDEDENTGEDDVREIR